MGVVWCDYPARLSGMEKMKLLERHNELRRTEAYEEGVDSMMETEWNEGLANEAEAYAALCEKYERAGPKYQVSVGYLKKRENIFGTYNDWFANKDKFDYGTGGCKGRSEQCAKYLNIVEENSFKIGCGRSYCNTIEKTHPAVREKFFFVCFFNTSATNVPGRGNKIFEKPYKKLPSPCMHCKGTTKLERGLCAETM